MGSIWRNLIMYYFATRSHNNELQAGLGFNNLRESLFNLLNYFNY